MRSFLHSIFVSLVWILWLGLAGSCRAGATSENVTRFATLHQYPACSDLWAYQAPDGTEIVILAALNGVAFIDVTDPSQPTEVAFFPGGPTLRDIKTFGHYAYVVEDMSDYTFFIYDLSDPLQPVLVNQFLGEWEGAHNLWIDEELGLAFANPAGGRRQTYVYDLNPDPTQPVYVRTFGDWRIHDMVTRDGLAYMAGVAEGRLYIYDISDIYAGMPPVGSASTPLSRAHNVWLTEDGTHAVCTDETAGGALSIFDVSDPSQPRMVSTYAHPDNPSAIVHNATVNGDFGYIAWYTNGFEVVDLRVPTHPERVAFDDFHPSTGATFDGGWGAYPFSPSGKIFVTGNAEGLWIFDVDPNFASLEGVITDATSGQPLAGAALQVLSLGIEATTDESGFFKFNVDPGSYELSVSAFGYQTAVVPISVSDGDVSDQSRGLARAPGAALQGRVIRWLNGAAVSGATVEVLGSGATTLQTAETNLVGDYVFPHLPAGTHTVRVSHPGLGEVEESVSIGSGGPSTLDVGLSDSAIFHDFESASGWGTQGDGTTGAWERVDPNGTVDGLVQPEHDHSPNPGSRCFVTGQSDPGATVSNNDVDEGTQTLISPVLDLSGYTDAHLSFYLWYVNNLGSATDDDLWIEASTNGGTDWTRLETVAETNAHWQRKRYRLEDHVSVSSAMRFRIVAQDLGEPTIVEAAVDDFEIFGPNETTDVGGGHSGPDGTALFEDPVSLSMIRPNPVPPGQGCQVALRLIEPRHGTVSIVDIHGRRLRDLGNHHWGAGAHEVRWDGRDDRGRQAPRGVYNFVLRIAPDTQRELSGTTRSRKFHLQ